MPSTRRRDPVSADGHVLGGIGVRAVGVVEDGGRKERGKVNRNKDKQQQTPGLDRRGEQRRFLRAGFYLRGKRGALSSKSFEFRVCYELSRW